MACKVHCCYSNDTLAPYEMLVVAEQMRMYSRLSSWLSANANIARRKWAV